MTQMINTSLIHGPSRTDCSPIWPFIGVHLRYLRTNGPVRSSSQTPRRIGPAAGSTRPIRSARWRGRLPGRIGDRGTARLGRGRAKAADWIAPARVMRAGRSAVGRNQRRHLVPLGTSRAPSSKKASGDCGSARRQATWRMNHFARAIAH
jgi:hypothetical protein